MSFSVREIYKYRKIDGVVTSCKSFNCSKEGKEAVDKRDSLTKNRRAEIR